MRCEYNCIRRNFTSNWKYFVKKNYEEKARKSIFQNLLQMKHSFTLIASSPIQIQAVSALKTVN